MRSGRDLHTAPKTEIVARGGATGLSVVLVRLQWDKDDMAYGIHADPNQFSTAGLQQTDFLKYLGFHRSACPFTGNQCFSRWGTESFDVNGFAQAFAEGYSALVSAERDLGACGIRLPQPEGWGYYSGKPSGTRSLHTTHVGGDGHTSPHTELMKQSEDENFRFLFSWIAGGSQKGWTTHYVPKHPPLSPEMIGAFEFLGTRAFPKCPLVDFDECRWRFFPFEPSGFMESNAEVAHPAFDAHATKFSPGIERLLAAHASVEQFGLGFIPMTQGPAARREVELSSRTSAPTPGSSPSAVPKSDDRSFDVALSFAGTERPLAEALATRVRDAGFRVFYDNFYPEELWGKDLPVFFDEIYRKRSRFCVMFVSGEYVNRMWTNHERRSAQARALQEKGNDYILPVVVEEVEVPGMPPTVGYLSIHQHPIESVAGLLIKKLGSTAPSAKQP